MAELSTDIKVIMKEPGVADLPMAVKAPFIRALRLERLGETAEALEALEKAIAAEEKMNAR